MSNEIEVGKTCVPCDFLLSKQLYLVFVIIRFHFICNANGCEWVDKCQWPRTMDYALCEMSSLQFLHTPNNWQMAKVVTSFRFMLWHCVFVLTWELFVFFFIYSVVTKLCSCSQYLYRYDAVLTIGSIHFQIKSYKPTNTPTNVWLCFYSHLWDCGSSILKDVFFSERCEKFEEGPFW